MNKLFLSLVALISMTTLGASNVLREAVLSNDPDTLCKILRDKNVEPAVCEDMLRLAASKGLALSVQVLVEHGVDINATDSYGNSPLLDAAMSGSIATVLYLTLVHNACPHYRTGEKKEPLSAVVPTIRGANYIYALGETREKIVALLKEYEETHSCKHCYCR